MVRAGDFFKSILAGIFLAVFLPIGSQIIFGQDCPSCDLKKKDLGKNQEQLKSHEELLQRNNTYLAGLKAEDVSKAIKVRSNILIIAARIETFKNNIESGQHDLDSGKCSSCPQSQ